MKFIYIGNNRYIKADEIVSVRLLPPTEDNDSYYIRIRSNYLTWQQSYEREEDAESFLNHIMSKLKNS